MREYHMVIRQVYQKQKEKNKPNEITWNDEIQVKLNRRNLKLENRRNEPKWILKNRTIMDYALKYMEIIGLESEIIAPINQVRLHKKCFYYMSQQDLMVK